MDAANLTRWLSEAALRCTEEAMRRADGVRLGHLLLALLEDPGLQQRVGDRHAEIAASLSRDLRRPAPSGGTFRFDLSALMDHAIALAQDAGAAQVSPLILAAACLDEAGLSDPDSRATQAAARSAGLVLGRLVRRRMPTDLRYAGLGYGRDLSLEALALDRCPLVGQDEALRRLVARLVGSSGSIALVGEPGVGKSALVRGLAWHLAHGTRPLVPEGFEDLTIVSVAASDLVAGTGARGELEQRIQGLLEHVAAHPRVVVFFDEVHTLLEGDAKVAEELKPAMAEGRFRFIAATTDQEYARHIAGNPALSSRMTRVLVREPTPEEATTILRALAPGLVSETGRQAGVTVPASAVEACVDLAVRYQRAERLPRKAIQLLAGALSEKTYRVCVDPDQDPALSREDLARTLSDTTGIPIDASDEDLGLRLGRHVVGQDPAVEAVSRWLRLQTKGWCDPRRPRGRFLFLGPPGVGKTELAHALAREVLHDPAALVVKNMAEYSNEGAKSRFMGADPGYVGFGSTETVYSRVMMRPFSVVVLDEIEKAHPSLANPLLSLLDGAGEDGQGRWVDFSQCLVVMTSNAIQVPASPDIDIRATLRAVGGVFTAPFVDRLDRTVVFEALDAEALAGILRILIRRRREHAREALPEALAQPEVQARILERAVAGSGSARGLERALQDWLEGAAEHS